MKKYKHPKAIRRWILEKLYERYLENPTEMLGPEDFLETGKIDKKQLAVNIHYLFDRNLVELITGYNPPLFVAVRITPKGIDLVEDSREFDRLFPAFPEGLEEDTAEILDIMEQLVVEADLTPLEGEIRKNMLRDIQYLRDELSKPARKWRKDVIEHVIQWIENSLGNLDRNEYMPSLLLIQEQVRKLL
ncbi:MAG TPA: hypothetical protein PLT82_07965 [Candidatus Hydrogenedens sp.]|nr:hypothetical protein [Candidatus Hydrogenedens sp.]HOK09196.1 hypothetical protein [Candidatus Hydrogenedens sp.]HOL20048.1 hypothetical protein [Candidatus Hydrogenedens sp.]HPP59051.1 hypothetical protein [Candidatus Hydrogenedens sp.]